MSSTDLAIHTLRVYHGEVVAAVAECLLLSGSLTLQKIRRSREKLMNEAEITSALLVLIQHGMVEFEDSKTGVEYKIYQDRVIHRLYFDKELQCASLLYGSAAEILVEELQRAGRLPINTLVGSATEKLNTALKAEDPQANEIQPRFVQEKFERMVATHFIKRCSVPSKNAKGRIVQMNAVPLDLMFVVPPKVTTDNTVRVKQEDTDEPPAKRQRFEPEASQQDGADKTVYWEVNHKRFLRHFRDQMLVSAVANAMESEKAAEVMRTILRHCEKTTDTEELRTLPISFEEIFSQMPKDKWITRPTLEQWLKLLTDNMPEFITKVGSSGGGTYIVNTFQALERLCIAHIESVVEERFGTKSRRIFQLILHKKHVEEAVIQRSVLMPIKESKELLCTLFQEHFVRLSTLSKTPDYAPTHSIFLFTVDVAHVARKLLGNSYMSLKNVIHRRQQLMSDSKRLLEKQDRVEALIMSLGVPASYMNGDEEVREVLDEEKKEQVDTIIESIVPSEKEQLKKIKAVFQYLDLTEHVLIDSTILLLESYLALTLRPPPPKRTRNLLI